MSVLSVSWCQSQIILKNKFISQLKLEQGVLLFFLNDEPGNSKRKMNMYWLQLVKIASMTLDKQIAEGAYCSSGQCKGNPLLSDPFMIHRAEIRLSTITFAECVHFH